MTVDGSIAKRDRKIFRLWQQGIPRAEIARRFGLHPNAIPCYIKREAERQLHRGSRKISFTDEQCREILALHRGGHSIGEIATRFAVNWRVIKRNLPANEPPCRKRRSLTREQRSEILSLSAAGRSPADIGRQLTIDPKKVRHALQPRPSERRPDDPGRITHRIGFTEREFAAISDRYRAGESAYSIAGGFNVADSVIKRILREAGIQIVDAPRRRIERDARILATARRGLTIAETAAELGVTKMIAYHVVAKAAATDPTAYPAYPRGPNTSKSERDWVRQSWELGLTHAALAERSGFKQGRITAILSNMRRRGEIGARPVAIRALAKLALVKLRTPAVEIPALLLEMARGASSREITRQWGANPEIMRKFLAQFRRDLDADPTAPAALTIVLADQVPEILRQRARGASVTDLARQWRINLKAMSRFLLRLKETANKPTGEIDPCDEVTTT